MTNSKRSATHRATIVLLCLTLAAACSGAPAQPATKALQKVTLQLQWVTQAQFAGYYVALDKGYYADEKIDLTIKPGGPDVSPADLVSSGTADFGTALLADLTTAIQSGKPLISIAQIQQANGLILVANKSSGIKQPKDFVGKKVGVWLGAWEAQFDALLAKEGIAPDTVQVVSQGFSMDPFLKGDLNVASAMIYNEYYTVLESGVKPENLTVIDYAAYGLDFPGDTLFTNKQTVQKNPDLCIRMLRASLKGWQYAIDHPADAADIVLRYDKSGVQTKDHQLSMMLEIAKLVQAPGRSLGQTDQASVQRTIDSLLRYNILKGPVKIEDVYTNEFWNQAHK
jgi:NitT/TauT family transport system substrate-binding protein